MQLLRSIAGLPQLHHLSLSWLGWDNPMEDGLPELAACRSSSLTHLNLHLSGIKDHAAIGWVKQAPSSELSQHEHGWVPSIAGG